MCLSRNIKQQKLAFSLGLLESGLNFISETDLILMIPCQSIVVGRVICSVGSSFPFLSSLLEPQVADSSLVQIKTFSLFPVCYYIFE